MDGNASVDPTQDNDDTDDLVSTSILLHVRFLSRLRLYFNRRKQDSTQCLTPSSRRISFFILSSNCVILLGKFIYSCSKQNGTLHLTREHFLDLLDFNAIDDMCRRMDGVEKSVYDLRAELGGGNAPPSVLPDAKYDFEPPRYI
ncbi:hypothetical protein GQ457_01G030740 [Hibiscus cannabinus]